MRNYIKSSLLIAVITFSFFKTTAQDTTSHSLPAGWFQIPKTNFRFTVAGYVKLDMIHDFDPIGSPDFFDVTKIPTDGSKGSTSHIHAKESRMWLDVRSPSKIGEVKAYLEGDFYGTSSAFRLRHAYAEFGGKLLVGQTWTNFMDENIIPPTLDFEKPGAYAFARHGLIRWKQPLSPASYLSFALEEPAKTADPPPQPGKLETPLPDFTARFRHTKKWGHIQLSGYVGVFRFRPATGANQDEIVSGVNLSGQFNTGQRDKFIYQAVYGPGLAQYRGGKSATFDANGNFKAATGVGFTVGYLHYWHPSWSSFIVLNYGEEDLDYPPTDVKNLGYGAVNLLWHFIPGAFAGVEYLWGRRENVNGDDGVANRIHFAVKYAFNTH